MEKSIKQTLIEKLYATKEDYKSFNNLLSTLKTSNPTRVDKIKIGAIFARTNYTSFRMHVIADLLSEIFQEDLSSHFTYEELQERKFIYDTINSYNVEDGKVSLPKAMEEAIELLEKQLVKPNA